MHASAIRAKEILSRLGADAKGAELGVFCGDLSSRLLVKKDLHLTMVDCWGDYSDEYLECGDFHARLEDKQQQRAYEDAVAKTEFAGGRRTILRMDSVKAASKLEDGSLDFVFVDADHTYTGCKADIEAWVGKLKPGGLLCGHDYRGHGYVNWDVKRAVDEFALERGLSVDLGGDDTWFVRMPGELPAKSNCYHHIVVCCLKWGNKYTSAYVNVLADMVARNLGVPYEFVCFTDNPTGIDDEVTIRDIPRAGLPGWWNKLRLFRKESFEPNTRVVFFDLDVAIVGPLEELIDSKGIPADWCNPGYNSSVMVWDHGEHSDVWEKFHPSAMERLPGDQDWITELGGWPLLPSGMAVSYRLHAVEWPPENAKVVCFHGVPKPHQVLEGWVPEIWQMNGLAVPRYFSKLNNDNQTIKDNHEANKANDFPALGRALPETGVPLCVVGGGPSLKSDLISLRIERAKGAKIWACNGAHDYLISQGIIPDGMVMLDSRKDNTAFLQNVRDDVTYYIATQCDPACFDLLDGKQVLKWAAWHWCVDDEVIIGGGQTVGLKAICLAFVMGFRKFKLFGFDSSYQDGENHAYSQTLNDGEATTEVIVKGRKFLAAKWMVHQAKEFQDQARHMVDLGCEFEIYGDGLLPAMCRVDAPLKVAI